MATAKIKLGARPYTGTSDGIAQARRAGMDEWIKQAIAASDNTLNNLGSYMVRDQKGHKGVLSVHSTGTTDPADYAKGAIAAIIPPIMRWVNKNDQAFGRGNSQS